ncbi:TonB-dependent receptor [Sphingomonadaceae bacterium jetA1]|jgi:iron complex outermembrane receptor protein|uniref:TonB-dependent receptor n=1 Tax=Facivitalis istanbulensis TaxID=3075838 RepID=UPI00347508BE
MAHSVLATAPITLLLPNAAHAQAVANASTKPVAAEDTNDAGDVVVTAQRTKERLLDVPLSVSTLSGQRLDSRFSGGDTILALAGAVPGLYIETSGGRTAPRLYMRGLGNTDFNQAASQPVSVVIDDVPMEKSGLRSYPIFDIDRVEVVRGPQGTLFGRNTTAGIVKFDSRRPTMETEGFVRASIGSYSSANVEAAVGGPIVTDTLAVRVSFLSQNRADWINNGFTGERNALGGYNDMAERAQILWTPAPNVSALFLYQGRTLRGNSSTPFRANILTKGSNALNGNYHRDTVFYDGGGNQRSEADQEGYTAQLNWQFSDLTLTSISSLQSLWRYGRADVDGGYGPGSRGSGPGVIPFPVDTGSESNIRQFSQELRLASGFTGPFNFQVGAFYFSDRLNFKDRTAAEPSPSPSEIGIRSTSLLENKSWAVFAHGTYDLLDALRLTVGTRYTHDEKDEKFDAPTTSSRYALAQRAKPIHLEGNNLSWDVALSYHPTAQSQIYGRIATGFRAPTIQTTLTTDPTATTARSEKITSYEVGYKANLFRRLSLDAAAFYYRISDMQLTAVGGDTPDGAIRLLNAKAGIGYGFEADANYAVTDRLRLTAGFGYAKTRIDEPGLSTGVCFSCTVLDPRNRLGRAIIDGNSFAQAPLWTANADLDYRYPVSPDAELFLFTDWRLKGRTNFFLYDSIEFVTGTQVEGGARVGYRNKRHNYEVAAFARNITNASNLLGGIDFNNLAGYVNEPRIIGAEVRIGF